MTNSRVFRVGLGPELRIRGFGAFGDDNPLLAWSQPSGTWQAMLFHCGGSLTMNGERSELAPWSLAIVPPGARCEIQWQGEPQYVYDYFGFVPEPSPENAVALPQATDLGTAGPFWDIEFRKGLSVLNSSGLHASAVAKAMLWSAALPASALRRNVYVAEAERLIAAESGPRLKVSELAKSVGLSQAQLGRLFVAEHGTTPLQYIRNVQARRAHELLTGTVEPIKSIAIRCGLPDVHAFNRFVRARLGASPREIRAGIGTVDVFRVEEYRQRNLTA